MNWQFTEKEIQTASKQMNNNKIIQWGIIISHKLDWAKLRSQEISSTGENVERGELQLLVGT